MGFVHHLFYAGDTLQSLAINGLILALLFYLPKWALLSIAVCLLLQAPTWWFKFYAFLSSSNTPPSNPEFWGLMSAHFQNYAHSSLIDIAKYNLAHGYYTKWVFGLETAHHWNQLGMVILGLWAGKLRFFETLNLQTKKLAYMILISLLLAVLFWLLNSVWRPILPDNMVGKTYGEILSRYFSFCVVGIYICGFALLYQATFFRVALTAFAPCGSMTLTLYIGQSLIFVPIFYGYGLGLYEHINQLQALTLGFTNVTDARVDKAISLWSFRVVMASRHIANDSNSF